MTSFLGHLRSLYVFCPLHHSIMASLRSGYTLSASCGGDDGGGVVVMMEVVWWCNDGIIVVY